VASFFDGIRQQLGYMLSLPERTLRSMAAVAGGTTSLLTETLFPDSLRGTTLYKVFIGDAQKFIVEKVAQVQAEGGPAIQDAGDNAYLQKKMVGGALETAGLFAMHFSPLWVFAIAGDAAAGSGVFLNRLVEQLKRNGVIPKHTEVHGLADLLVSIQDASRKSAGAVDTPPLSRQELANLADDMLTSYGRIFSRAGNLVPRIETLWEQMQEVASRENVSLEKLGGILTVDVASWGRKGVGSLLAFGQTGQELLGEQILDSYARTLDQVSEEGVSCYVSKRMKPFLHTAATHFDPERKTWTESFLSRLGAEACVEAPSDTAAAAPAAVEVVIVPAGETVVEIECPDPADTPPAPDDARDTGPASTS
jgi:hypothetical protein